MESKLVLHTLVYLSITLLVSVLNAEHFTKVENIFQQNVSIKPGDVMQCEITKTNLEESTYKSEVHTTGGPNTYLSHPTTEKCFSFKVRALRRVYIFLSSITSIDDSSLEIKLESASFPPYSTMEQNSVILMRANDTGVVNDKEYRGFWIRWLDDGLVEIGRDWSTKPLLYYRFLKPLQINYVGITTLFVNGEWIIDLEPQCPGTKVQKTKTESDCFLLKKTKQYS